MGAAKQVEEKKSEAPSLSLVQGTPKGTRPELDPVVSRMNSIIADCGSSDTLRHTILYYISLAKYDRSKDELTKYVDARHEYPLFRVRARLYVDSAIQMIDAIQKQRSVLGVKNWSFSKQQDFFEKIIDHFENLKNMLVRIEQTDMEVKLEDVRSTVVVIKTLMVCVTGFVSITMITKLGKSLWPTVYTLGDHYLGELVNKLFSAIGWQDPKTSQGLLE